MKNKKIILFTTSAVLFIVIGLYINKFQKNLNNKADHVYFYKTEENDQYGGPKDIKIFSANLNTSHVTESKDPNDISLVEFSGLPEKVMDDNIYTTIFPLVFSTDKTKAIISVVQLDKKAEPSAFDGSLPVIKTENYICIILDKKCSETDIITKAKKKYLNWSAVYLWNPEKNIILTHPSGEGVGDSGPVIVYDYIKDSITSVGSDSFKPVLDLRVPNNSISPSSEKFLIFDFKEIDNPKLKIYNINNLKISEKEISIINIDYGYIGSVAWSPDEKSAALIIGKKIYTIDLLNGNISLKFEDNTSGKGGMYLDFNNLQYSKSGEYLVFVDYVENFDILKKIKLSDGSISEVVKSEFISLI